MPFERIKKFMSLRSKSRFPAINPALNLKIRHDDMDQDYIDKLTDEEKDWLNRFNEEYVNTNFNHEGERIHPKKYTTKTVKKTGKRRKIDVYKQESENRNNRRNNDSYAITKCNGMLKGEDSIHGNGTKNDSVEDALIAFIDKTNGKKF